MNLAAVYKPKGSNQTAPTRLTRALSLAEEI
jgi:hypothetical protein